MPSQRGTVNSTVIPADSFPIQTPQPASGCQTARSERPETGQLIVQVVIPHQFLLPRPLPYGVEHSNRHLFAVCCSWSPSALERLGHGCVARPRFETRTAQRPGSGRGPKEDPMKRAMPFVVVIAVFVGLGLISGLVGRAILQGPFRLWHHPRHRCWRHHRLGYPWSVAGLWSSRQGGP